MSRGLKRLLLTSLILTLAYPAQAQVELQVHNLCKGVADYTFFDWIVGVIIQ